MKHIVSAERLQQANSFVSISQNVVLIFGPTISAFFVNWIGFGFIFLFDAATFLVGILFLALLQVPNGTLQSSKKSMTKEVKEGLREFRKRPWLWATTIAFSLQNFVIASYNILGPFVAQHELHGATDWSFILAGGTVGGVVGGIVALQLKPSYPMVFSLVLASLFVPLEVIALVPPFPLWLIILTSFLASTIIVIKGVFFATLLQQHIPSEVISRVDSIESLATFLFMPLGFVLVGPLSKQIGIETTLLMVAMISVLGNIAALMFPSIRSL